MHDHYQDIYLFDQILYKTESNLAQKPERDKLNFYFCNVFHNQQVIYFFFKADIFDKILSISQSLYELIYLSFYYKFYRQVD